MCNPANRDTEKNSFNNNNNNDKYEMHENECIKKLLCDMAEHVSCLYGNLWLSTTTYV
jgi:hypothetical protein